MCLSSFCSLIVMDSTLTQRVISRDSNLQLKMMLFKIWLYCQYWLEEVIHIYITYIISVLGYLCSVRKVTQIWRSSMQPCLTLWLYWLEEVTESEAFLSTKPFFAQLGQICNSCNVLKEPFPKRGCWLGLKILRPISCLSRGKTLWLETLLVCRSRIGVCPDQYSIFIYL